MVILNFYNHIISTNFLWINNNSIYIKFTIRFVNCLLWHKKWFLRKWKL